jgi:hypothetical protein
MIGESLKEKIKNRFTVNFHRRKLEWKRLQSNEENFDTPENEFVE